MSELAPWEKFSVEKPHASICLTERVAYSSQLPIKSAKLDKSKQTSEVHPQ